MIKVTSKLLKLVSHFLSQFYDIKTIKKLTLVVKVDNLLIYLQNSFNFSSATTYVRHKYLRS